MYNIVRLQRDMGKQSRLGMVYTDKADGKAWNRVLGVDGRLVRGVYSLQGQLASSFTGGNTEARMPALWDVSLLRNGREFYARYGFSAISDGFDAQSGFIARTGVSLINATHRVNIFPSVVG